MNPKETLKLRILTLVLSVVLLTSLMPLGNAFFWDKETLQPAISTFSKNIDSGKEISFSVKDFESRLSTGAKLSGICISELPDPTAGKLKVSGREVLRGDGIALESLNDLKFYAASEKVSATFSFIPVFKDGVVGTEAVKVSLHLGGKANSTPVAESLTFETYTNISIAGVLKGTDPDGEALTYRILDKPKLGEAVCEKNAFRYQPHQNKTGTDTFTYVAVDAAGNASDPAKVTIEIRKRRDKEAFYYEDMESHSSHFAAIRLAEEGIIVGEKVGASYFLRPNQAVSRGEFIAMAVASANLSKPAAALNTGLSDDKATPTWVKPYVSAALKAGIIHGSADGDGQINLRSGDTITRAEAAVIMNNVASLADESRDVFYSDAAEIPAWAKQATINLDAVDLIHADANGALKPSAAITRAEAVQMVYDTFCFNENNKGSKGFFSWGK